MAQHKQTNALAKAQTKITGQGLKKTWASLHIFFLADDLPIQPTCPCQLLPWQEDLLVWDDRTALLPSPDQVLTVQQDSLEITPAQSPPHKHM